MKALFDSIHEMKSRADQSAIIIAQITADPQALQIAGSRINGGAKTYESLNGLISTVNELARELREAEFDYYRTVAELLVDAQSQMASFTHYLALPQVAFIKQKITAIEKELGRQVQWGFREIGPLASSEKYGHEQDPSELTWNIDVAPLAQVYSVIDALGEKFRKDLLERFAQLQLIPYEKLFQAGSKYAGIEFLDQRFAWFNYLIGVVNDKLSSVIPFNWFAPYHLFLEFCRRTKNHFIEILSQAERENSAIMADMTLIIKSLKSCIDFENKMITSFTQAAHLESENVYFTITESIRDAFDPYLGPYVQNQRMGLTDLVQRIMIGEETPVPKSGEAPVDPHAAGVPFNAGEPYDSSRHVFEYIKNSMTKCANYSTGMTFLNLSKEFRAALTEYAEKMKLRCPPPEKAAKGDQPAIYRINKTMEKTLCKVICTGEYCIDTIPALENLMKQKIKEQYREEINFNPQIEAFQDMVAFAMNILATGEVYRMQEYYAKIKSVNWSTFEDFGDVQEPVKAMLRVFTDCMPRIRLTMSEAYYLQFSTRIASMFLEQYLDLIWRLRRISKTGAAQLQIDMTGIKEYLLKMPNVKLPEGKEPLVIGKIYLRTMEKKIGRIENILKLLSCEDSMVDELFLVLLPDCTPKEKDAILIAKGMKLFVPVPVPLGEAAAKIRSAGENTSENIRSGAKDTMVGIKKGIDNIGGGFRGVFGDMMHGNLFMDTSGHSDLSGHGSETRPASQAGAKKDLKSVVGGIKAFGGFSGTSSGGGGSSSHGASTTKK